MFQRPRIKPITSCFSIFIFGEILIASTAGVFHLRNLWRQQFRFILHVSFPYRPVHLISSANLLIRPIDVIVRGKLMSHLLRNWFGSRSFVLYNPVILVCRLQYIIGKRFVYPLIYDDPFIAIFTRKSNKIRKYKRAAIRFVTILLYWWRHQWYLHVWVISFIEIYFV